MSGKGQADADSRGALDRGLEILDYLATHHDRTVADVAADLSLSRSTAYRLLDRLQTREFIVQDAATGFWLPGPAAKRLAFAAVRSADVMQVAPELLRVLVQQTQETVGLAVPNGDEMVFIYRERGPHSVGVNIQPGARRPLHCTGVGKAYLGALPSAELATVLGRLPLERHTDATITDVRRLEADILATRDRGWSEDRAEFDLHSTCCGAAILDHTGRPVAAISASGLSERTAPQLARLGPVVASTAAAISRHLGYVGVH
jgi:DNA-binding IclR family transcriptional regulator